MDGKYCEETIVKCTELWFLYTRRSKLKKEEGRRSRQRQEMRGFMLIEAVAEAEAENKGRKRE